MWLKVYKPKRFGLSWFINWVRTKKLQLSFHQYNASTKVVVWFIIDLCPPCSSDLHCYWSAAAGSGSDRRDAADYFVSHDIQILPVKLINWSCMHHKMQKARRLVPLSQINWIGLTGRINWEYDRWLQIQNLILLMMWLFCYLWIKPVFVLS